MLLSSGDQVSPLALALQVRTETLEDSREEEFRWVGGTDILAPKWPRPRMNPFFPPGIQMLQLRSQEPQVPH